MKGKEGFTLVETLLTVALLSIIVIIIGGTMNLSKLMMQQSSTDSAVQGNLKRTLQILTREMSEGLNKNDPLCPNNCGTPSCTAELDLPNFVCIVPAQAVSFKTPEPFDNGTHTITYKVTNYTFDSNAHTISRLEVSSGGVETQPQVIASNISAVNFQKISTDPDPVVIQITLTSGTVSQRSEVTLRSAKFEA